MAPRASGRASTEYRKLQQMIKDLKALKRELLPDEKDKALEAEMKNFDDFQHKKHALQTLLSEIREDVDRLNDQRKKLGEEGRDTITIRLASENTHRLKQATELLQELRKQQDKDEKRGKGSKRKLSEKELAERREMVILIGNQLQQLVRDNQRSKALENPEDAAMQDRVERRKAEQEARTREKREERRRARKAGRKGADAAIDEDDFKEVGPRSEQEQAFEQQVQQNREQQDKMLEEISGVLTDLHELAVTANKQLAVQSAMIDEIDKQMDNTISNFKAANKRLKTILEESGGMERWCPVIICLVVLLALIGYMFTLGKH